MERLMFSKPWKDVHDATASVQRVKEPAKQTANGFKEVQVREAAKNEKKKAEIQPEGLLIFAKEQLRPLTRKTLIWRASCMWPTETLKKLDFNLSKFSLLTCPRSAQAYLELPKAALTRYENLLDVVRCNTVLKTARSVCL